METTKRKIIFNTLRRTKSFFFIPCLKSFFEFSRRIFLLRVKTLRTKRNRKIVVKFHHIDHTRRVRRVRRSQTPRTRHSTIIGRSRVFASFNVPNDLARVVGDSDQKSKKKKRFEIIAT